MGGTYSQRQVPKVFPLTVFSLQALRAFIAKLIATDQQNVILSGAKNLDIKMDQILHFVQDDTRQKLSTRYELVRQQWQ